MHGSRGPDPSGDLGGEQARARADVGDDHPFHKAHRVDNLVAVLNDLQWTIGALRGISPPP